MNLRFGIFVVSGLIFTVAIVLSIELLILAFNAYWERYYIVISYLLLIPLYIACAFHFYYGRSKSYSQRFYLILGVILAGISILTLYLYTIFYIERDYPEDYVMRGSGDRDKPGNYT